MCCFLFKVISLCTSGWLPGWLGFFLVEVLFYLYFCNFSMNLKGVQRANIRLFVGLKKRLCWELSGHNPKTKQMARQFKSEAKTSTVVLNHKSKPKVQLFRTELGMSNLKIATMLMKKMFLKQLIHCFKNIYIVDTQSLNKHVHQSLIMQVVSNAVYQISKYWN